MCYTAATKEAQTPHIANEDIKVYKLCKLCNNKVLSIVQLYTYRPYEKQHTISLRLLRLYNYFYIENGYHSYKHAMFIDGTHNIIINDKGHTKIDNAIIGEFIIPKGSTYYENNSGEIVSSNIIFTGIFSKPYYDNHYKIVIGKYKIDEKDRTVFNKISG